MVTELATASSLREMVTTDLSRIERLVHGLIEHHQGCVRCGPSCLTWHQDQWREIDELSAVAAIEGVSLIRVDRLELER